MPTTHDQTAPPCAECRTTRGLLTLSGRPIRICGARFGIPGKLCKSCWQRHRIRQARGRAVKHVERLEIPLAEIPPRVTIVRQAKRAKEARGLEPILTDAELDAILPPVDCWRTRERLRRGGATEFHQNFTPEGASLQIVTVAQPELVS
jgi:hypothetical protein